MECGVRIPIEGGGHLTCDGSRDSAIHDEQSPIFLHRFGMRPPVQFPADFGWPLIPFGTVGQVARVLVFGAKKYRRDGWKYIPNAREHHFNSAMNHLTAWAEGERFDNESGLPHLAHAAARVLFLIWFEMNPTKEIDK